MFDELLTQLEHIPPKMLKKILSGVVWEGTPDSGTMALTFDDGPDPEVTPPVLDALDAANARGTFFMVGEKVAGHPDIARAVAERGHCIGSHSLTHRTLFLTGRKEVEREIDESLKIIGEITGITPVLFRPPHGLFDLTCVSVVRERGLSMVLWSVLSGDYSDDPPDVLLDRIEPFVRAGSIVVFHDTAQGGNTVLPGLIADMATIARTRDVGLDGVDRLSFSSDIELDNDDGD